MRPPVPHAASATPAGGVRSATAILVISCDRYADVWPHFFGCFFRYWPDCPYRVLLGTNHLQYDDPRVTTICIGEDRDYSSNLSAMLGRMDEEWVMVFVEDILFSAPVDSGRIMALMDTLQGDGVVHAQLLYKRYNQHNLLPPCGRAEGGMSELPVGVPYRTSLNVGLWRKADLVALLREGESAWEFERDGTVRSFGHPGRFVSVACPDGEPLFRWEHGVIKGQWTWEAVRFIRRQTRTAALRRPVQSFGSYLYLQIYSRLRYLAFWLAYKVWGQEGLMKVVLKRAN
jgi:hypothetical protein